MERTDSNVDVNLTLIIEPKTMPFRSTLLLIMILVGLLGGCTRSRPSTEPAVSGEPDVLVDSSNSGAGNSGEPLVTIITSTQTLDDNTQPTPVPEATMTPSTIDYTVEDGDTLFFVAQKFGVDMETVRRLNYLITDDIYVGQILQMPYSAGVTAEGVPTPTPEPFRYTVAAGDSLGSIAEQFGVSLVAIMEANSMSDPNSLFVGQSLVIPGYVVQQAGGGTEGTTTVDSADTAATENNASQDVTHVVQPGDTLYGIAQVYGVEAVAIVSANNIANSNQLRAGQRLVIPGITERDAAAARGRIHIVQSGESLTAIAELYGVTPQEIIDFNGISNPDTIYVGQDLVIPGQ